MKTSKKPESDFTESSINSRLEHKAFITHATKSASVKAKKLVRSVDRDNQMFVLLGIEDWVTRSKVSIHPEFIAFAFHLYGLSRKLFLYLVFFELDNNSGTFKIDAGSLQRFRDFHSLFKEDEQPDTSILQAARTLIRKNIMILLDNETYMMNPLIAGGANEHKRRKLIDCYSKHLERKGLDTSLHFYPKYQFVK